MFSGGQSLGAELSWWEVRRALMSGRGFDGCGQVTAYCNVLDGDLIGWYLLRAGIKRKMVVLRTTSYVMRQTLRQTMETSDCFPEWSD